MTHIYPGISEAIPAPQRNHYLLHDIIGCLLFIDNEIPRNPPAPPPPRLAKSKHWNTAGIHSGLSDGAYDDIQLAGGYGRGRGRQH